MFNKLSVGLTSFAACYILLQIGNIFTLPFGYASPLLPVAGFIMGMYFIYGPWLLLSAFCSYLLFSLTGESHNTLSLTANFVMATSATLQLIIAKWLVLRFCSLPVKSHNPFEIIKFLFLTGPAACLPNALVSYYIFTTSLNYPSEILVYLATGVWVGNLLSVVFITPVILFLRPNIFVRKAFKPFAAIATTALVILTVSAVYSYTANKHKEEEQRLFVKATQQYVEKGDVFINSLKHNLTALDGLIQASEYISKQEFAEFSEAMLALHSNNAIRAFAWMPKISKTQRIEFEQELMAQEELFAKIRRATENGIIVAPEQAYYLPIKYSVPYEKNKLAIGLDVLVHNTVGMSVRKSIDEATFVLSPLFPLIQEQGKATGAVVYYPSFDRSSNITELSGVTEVVLEVDLLLDNLHQQPSGELYTYELEYEGNVYAHPDFNQNAKFSHIVEFDLFDKKAKLTFVSTDKFEQQLVYWNGFLILLTGLVIGIICVMFVFFIVTFNASLSRQVSQSTKKLVEQNDELAKANAAKNLFLANISHEYRTPLNAIIGFTDIAKNEVTDKASLSYFEQINNSSNILLGIVNDVLDYSKMQAGELRLEPRVFNLRQACQNIIDLLRDKADKKSVEMTFNTSECIDAWVKADEVRVKQILINLINNAVKFTEQGQVSIKCSSRPIADRQRLFTISIADTGIGIAPVALEELFKPFAQAEASTNRRFGGTGLGLSIVRQLCQLMQGNVKATSKLGEGSTFTVTLPLQVVDAPTSEKLTQSPTVVTSYPGMRVLVAEDNKVNQLVISKHLENLGVDFVIAENGERAINLLQQQPIDLILMDLQMPVMDGFTASGVIKSDPAWQHIPIVILSASVGEEEKDKAKELGIFDYIEKPFKREQLLTMFNKYYRSN